MLTTLTPVQQGELRIFGLDSRRQTTDIRSNIGYVPQQLSIEPALTGQQNVEWFARLYGVARAERAQRVEQALGAMDLLDVADRLAGAYSGGMVRRLEVAQALVNRPSLLVLDEPTVGLDPIARDGVWKHVQNMQAQFGMTVLLTTHYMEEADALCDRVALMHRGVLQAVGTPTDLKSTVSLGRLARGRVPPLRGIRLRRINGRVVRLPRNPFQQKGCQPCQLITQSTARPSTWSGPPAGGSEYPRQ